MAINKTNQQLLLTGAETVFGVNASKYSISKTFGVSSCGVCLPLLIRDYLIINLFNCKGISALTEQQQEDLLNKASNNTHISFVEEDCGEETYRILNNPSGLLLINNEGDSLLWL